MRLAGKVSMHSGATKYRDLTPSGRKAALLVNGSGDSRKSYDLGKGAVTPAGFAYARAASIQASFGRSGYRARPIRASVGPRGGFVEIVEFSRRNWAALGSMRLGDLLPSRVQPLAPLQKFAEQRLAFHLAAR
jgi:hypothetical protein